MSATKKRVVGFFTLGIGVVALVGAIVLGRQVLEIRAWPTAQATVIERGVGAPEQPTGGTRNARFVPKVRYAFEVDGQPYEASGLGPAQESMTEAEARSAAEAVPDSVEVHYDPDDPARAYIETGSLTFAIILGVVGALFALIGGGMVIGGGSKTS